MQKYSYAIKGASRILPGLLGRPVSQLSRLFPSKLMLPVAFGDIKLYVARKRLSC